jgi:hypothetical protein
VLVVPVRNALQVSMPAELYVLFTHEMRSRLGVEANAAVAAVRMISRSFADEARKVLRFG